MSIARLRDLAQLWLPLCSSCRSFLMAGLSWGLRLLLSQLILYSFGLSLNLCASGHFQRAEEEGGGRRQEGSLRLTYSARVWLSYLVICRVCVCVCVCAACVCALLALTDLCNYGTHSIMHGPRLATTHTHRHRECAARLHLSESATGMLHATYM